MVRQLYALIVLSAVAPACSGIGQGKNGSLQSAGLVPTAALGKVPGGLPEEKAEFVSLLRSDGVPVVAELTDDAELTTDVGKSAKLPVTKGSRVALIAQNGKFFRVLVKHRSKDRLATLEEGFVPADKINVLGALTDGHSIDLKPELGSVKATLGSTAGGEPGQTSDQSGPNAELGAESKDKKDDNSDPMDVPLSAEDFPPSDGSCLGVRFTGGAGADRTAATCGVGSASPGAESAENGAESAEHLFNSVPCMVAGEHFRQPQESSIFTVIGRAKSIKVTPISQHAHCVKVAKDECRDEKNRVYVPSTHQVSASDNEHTIQMSAILAERSSLYDGTRTFKFELRDESEKVTGVCTMHIRAVSPIVIDLTMADEFQGFGIGEAKVSFDLYGNGRAMQTGWIKPSMGLLARDLDGDGRISSGRELFGEGTVGTNGNRFSNGYLALAEQDANRDGRVDSLDPAYKTLLVWNDLNVNGVSEAGELRSLSSYGIQALSVLYGPSLRHRAPEIGQNDVRYESRYFGPKACGTEGCMTFDVFFATAHAQASK